MAQDRNQIFPSLLANVSGDLMNEISSLCLNNGRLAFVAAAGPGKKKQPKKLLNEMFMTSLCHFILIVGVINTPPLPTKLTDRSLLALYSVYGNVCERAVELLEKDCVTFLSDPDGIRTVIQVAGSGGSLYTLLPEVNYCPCPAFRYHVIGTKTDMSCKHVLAAHLATIMNKGSKRLIKSTELSELLVKSYTSVPTLEDS